MGREPVTKKYNAYREHEGYAYGLACMQGWRDENEDTHRVSLQLPGFLNNWSMAAIFDGHGGDKVAHYAEKNFLQKIVKRLNVKEHFDGLVPPHARITEGIIQGHFDLDQSMRRSKLIDDDSGCTAVSVFTSPTHFYFSNCGDSRAVLSRAGKVAFATKDHKPKTKSELQRIEAAGGYVGDNRVNGILALSRALGDFEFKANGHLPASQQMVTALPDVTVIDRSEADDFIVLGCDGIFDVISNSDLIKLISTELGKTNDLKKVCNTVVDRCFEKGSTDNMSAVILTFPNRPSLEERKGKRKLEFSNMTKTIREKKARDNHHLQFALSTAAPPPPPSQIVPGMSAGENNSSGDDVKSALMEDKHQKPPSPFLFYFMDCWKEKRGNICKVAKDCGNRWKTLKSRDKKKYKQRFRYHQKKLNKI